MGPRHALTSHWPEYLIEGWALGTFMVSAALFSTLLEYPGSAVHGALADADLRRVIVGICMGVTAVLLIYSPWGQRSGAHMNPAVTLTFWRLGKVRGWDAAFYVLAQFAGGTAGVALAALVLGDPFTAAPVRYAVTVPGPAGVFVAFGAEVLIAAGMMATVLTVSNTPRVAHLTGLCAGLLVALYISVEAPISGMSINPARSFASALPAGEWQAFWIYLVAPLAGMALGALIHTTWRCRPVGCAKLLHPADQRCIHCGYTPAQRPAQAPTTGLAANSSDRGQRS
jgi:aquaporin Z